MNDVKKPAHLNVTDAALSRDKRYCGQKTKDITEEEKEKYKAFFEGETYLFLLLKNLHVV